MVGLIKYLDKTWVPFVQTNTCMQHASSQITFPLSPPRLSLSLSPKYIYFYFNTSIYYPFSFFRVLIFLN